MNIAFPQTVFNVYHQPQAVFVPVHAVDSDGTYESMSAALAAATVVSDQSWCTLLEAGGTAPGFTFAIEHRTDLGTHFEPRTATIRITIPLPDGSFTSTTIVKINQYPATAQVAVAFMRYQTKIVYDSSGKEDVNQAEYGGSPLFVGGGTAYYSPNAIEGKWIRSWTQPQNALSTYLPICGTASAFRIRAEEQGAPVATVPLKDLGKSYVAIFASENTAEPTVSYTHNLTSADEGRVLFFNRSGSAPTLVVTQKVGETETEVYNGVLPTAGYIEIPIEEEERYYQVDVYEGGEHVGRAGMFPKRGLVIAAAVYLKTTVRLNAAGGEESTKTEFPLKTVNVASIDSPRTALSAALSEACNPNLTTFAQEADAVSPSQYTRATISDVGSSIGIGNVSSTAETLADWIAAKADQDQPGLVRTLELAVQSANESSSPRSASATIALPLDPDRTEAEWRSYSGAWINQNGVRERFISISPQWARAEFLGDTVEFSVAWKNLSWTLSSAPSWISITGTQSGDEPADTETAGSAKFNASVASTAFGSLPAGVIWLTGSWTDKKSGRARSLSVCSTITLGGSLAPQNDVGLKSLPPEEISAAGGIYAALWTTPADDEELVAQTNDETAAAAVAAPAGTTVSATTETGAAADWLTVGDTVSAGTGTDDEGNAVNIWKTSFTVAANASDAQRSAAVTIATATGAAAFAMTQVGVAVDSDDFAVAPAELTFGESGGKKQVAVFAGGAVQSTISLLNTDGSQTNIGNYHGFKFPFKDFASAAGIDKNSFNVELTALRIVIANTQVPDYFLLAVFPTSEVVTDFANASTFGVPTLISTAQRIAEFNFETPPLLEDNPYLFLYATYARSGTNVAAVRFPVFSYSDTAPNCPLTAYNPTNRAPVFNFFTAKVTAVMKITAKIPDPDALDWTATPNVDWLHAAPASGKGTAIVEISCDALPTA